MSGEPRSSCGRRRTTTRSCRRWRRRCRQEYVGCYGGPDETATDTGRVRRPDGVFLVGWVGRSRWPPAALRRHDATAAEIKRMYVVPRHRGRGHARAVLAALEDARGGARATGAMLLETGHAQPEAIALYESSGYAPIESFGHYRDSPLCRSFAKPLPDCPG